MIPKLSFVYDRKGLSTRTKSAVIELRITMGTQRKYVSTGIQVLPHEWSDGMIIGRKDWKELNDQLAVIKKKASEIVAKMMEDGEVEIGAIPNLLKGQFVVQGTFISYAKEIAQNRYLKISAGTKEHYELFFRFMDKWKGIVYFSDVNEKNIMKMDDVLRKKGLKEVSRWSYHKILKSFIIQGMDDGVLKKNPYGRLPIKRGNEDGLSRFLTPEEFHRFERCEIPIERLERVRDLFVFQTYTCMSYGDMCDFSYARCTTINGRVVYKAQRQKTGIWFTCVLLPQALAIIDKYNGRLPIISNVKYNEYLKAAVMYADIDKPVSTHWARHTGATMLLNEGKVPMHIVQHILGHASVRETEKTYAKVLDETIVQTMMGSFGRI